MTGTPLTSVTSGQGVSIEADGLDSTGGTVWFSPPVGAPFSMPVGCATAGTAGGVAASFVMPPTVTAGTWTVQITTTTTGGTSALSNPIVVTIY